MAAEVPAVIKCAGALADFAKDVFFAACAAVCSVCRYEKVFMPVVEVIARHAPIQSCDIHYFFAWADKKAVSGNLKVIFPEKSQKEINRIRITMFRNFAKYLVDFFRYSKLDPEYIKKNITVENKEYVDNAMLKGKGVITLTAHLGNWELGGVIISLLGYPFSAVALPHKDKFVDNFFNQQRASKGMKVIPLGKAVKQCLDTLKKNEILALVGDRDFSGKGMVLDFFGKPTFFPEGAAAFSLKTGASIVPGFMIRDKTDGFVLRFEKPLEFKATGNKAKDLEGLIVNYKHIFEDYIKKYPEQWYMFRRFWIV